MENLNPDLMQQIQQWTHTVLVWVGFGTIVGLAAKAIMPGRDPGGTIATLAMGVGGTMIGCGILSYFYQGEHITPISTVGFLVGTGGAFVLLFFYRMLSGRLFAEGGTRRPITIRRPHRMRRDNATEYVDVE
jgi:uncharacterized membrane protein YeaQ/YmgE (transglycosylase-associated protein family)